MKPGKDIQKPVRVLKFGGTCLHPARNREHVLARIAEEERLGHPVVAVVSAMGRFGDPYATDTLDGLVPPETPRADRERDALLCCGEGIAASLLAAELSAKGIRAVSIQGAQLGLFTNGCHGDAEILSVSPGLIQEHLDRGAVVVAAGFQGIGQDGSLTTLGRGGTDTAAVAIAAALGAEKVLFYKDVDALYNGDPRIVPAAKPLPMIPYDEAAHLAYAGAKVIHPRSADLAERYGISIEIKSLSKGRGGTLVTSRDKIHRMKPRGSDLFAVTCVEKIGQLTVKPEETRPIPGFPLRLFQELADVGISLDMINVLEDRALFTVSSEDVERAADIARWAGCEVQLRKDCAKVSLLGGGIHGVPGIMWRILSALNEVEVPVFQSVDTYTVISVLVEGGHATKAAKALHSAFGLGEEKGSAEEGSSLEL